MEQKLFSIIVPVYKVENYLPKCVQSILHQTFDDFQLILVDDGSPDGCSALCDEYAKDLRVQAVHIPNSGVAAARKVGVDNATGEYLIFVDGDDWLEPTYLEVFAKAIQEYAPDVLCCGWNESTEEEVRPLPLLHGLEGYYSKEKMKTDIYPILIEDEKGRFFPHCLWAKAYKRGLYARYQFLERRVTVGEDHACTKPCVFHANSVYAINKCLYHYRQISTSMTKAGTPYAWEGPKLIGQHYEKYIDMTEEMQAQVYRSVVHNLFNAAVSQFHRAEPYKVIKRDILAHIDDPYYQEAIEKCVYKGYWKGTLAQMALKRKTVWLMKLFSKIA